MCGGIIATAETGRNSMITCRLSPRDPARAGCRLGTQSMPADAAGSWHIEAGRPAASQIFLDSVGRRA